MQEQRHTTSTEINTWLMNTSRRLILSIFDQKFEGSCASTELQGKWAGTMCRKVCCWRQCWEKIVKFVSFLIHLNQIMSSFDGVRNVTELRYMWEIFVPPRVFNIEYYLFSKSILNKKKIGWFTIYICLINLDKWKKLQLF